MKVNKIRIGKDIPIEWTILVNGTEKNIESYDLDVEITDKMGNRYTPTISVENNVVSFTFGGIEQKYTGFYTITLWNNLGFKGQNAVDVVDAFYLTNNTEEETASSDSMYLCEKLEFKSNMNRMGDEVLPSDRIEKPTINTTTAEYTGEAISISITDTTPSAYTTKYYSGDTEVSEIVDVGTYTIVISLKENYKWSDGTTDDISGTVVVSLSETPSYIVKDNYEGKLDEMLIAKGYDSYDDCTYEDITNNKSDLNVTEAYTFSKADINEGGTYDVILIVSPKTRVVSVVDSIVGESLVNGSAEHDEYNTCYVLTQGASGIMLTIK